MYEDIIKKYKEDGFVVVRNLMPTDQALAARDHYMAKRAEGYKEGDMGGNSKDSQDPLNQYPRMIGMENWDAQTKIMINDPKANEIASALIGDQAEFEQSMLYFKPPGSRGQAFHQDCQYITKTPIIGIWMALDKTSAENGKMLFIPGSHKKGLLPVARSNDEESFTDGTTNIPTDLPKPIGPDLNPGDALFFGGFTIHGSRPNTTKDQFRRCLIRHYVGKHAKDFQPAKGYHMNHLPETTNAL